MYFRKKTEAQQIEAFKELNGYDYIIPIEKDSSSLKNHYLLKHPITKIVFGIACALLLIMLASLPADTARQVEKTPVILNYQDTEPISENNLFTSNQYHGNS